MCLRTGKHALIDDTFTTDENGITMHDTAMSGYLYHVSRHQQVGWDLFVLYRLTGTHFIVVLVDSTGNYQVILPFTVNLAKFDLIRQHTTQNKGHKYSKFINFFLPVPPLQTLIIPLL